MAVNFIAILRCFKDLSLDTTELQIYDGCELVRFSPLLKNAEFGMVPFLPLCKFMMVVNLLH